MQLIQLNKDNKDLQIIMLFNSTCLQKLTNTFLLL